MKTVRWFFLLLLGGVLVAGGALAQQVRIISIDKDGLLTWTNTSQCVTCWVEWAYAPQGPWHNDWQSTSNVVMTNPVAQQRVPRSTDSPAFFRVASSPTRVQSVTKISSQAGYNLITNRFGDPSFVILDVRTPSEYNPSHIRAAINLNLNSGTFSTDVARLSRCNTYVVYCASGGRSAQAVQIMQGLGFFEVYDIGGFSSFQLVSGSQDWIEP